MLFSKLKDREWLYDKYITDGLTGSAIAKIIGCSEGSVFYALKKAGISKKIKVKINHKYCAKCQKTKKSKFFNKNSRNKSGLSDYCIKCNRLYTKNNRGSKSAYDKKYRIKNLERKRRYERQYYKDHYPEIKQKRKKYNDKIRHITNKRHRDRRKNDINFRILGILRSRVKNALKGLVKQYKSRQLLGCSIPYLKLHLSKSAPEGFSWDIFNGRQYHIHHIKPCSSFDLTKKEQQIKCFHYTNLKIMIAVDNLRLGNRVK
jgi:hypothetical protein